LEAVRGDSKPEVPTVVLYQYDADNPMNPHGLLIAYAEACVKPVVSDFDTFTVGSRGMEYAPLPREQYELANWVLDTTHDILKRKSPSSWTTTWLEVTKAADYHPEMPEYGFGDPTSQSLIKSIVQATADSGAVRHGAECFNFAFPQELDSEFLIIWENFPDKPWGYFDEDDLRKFLLQRIKEGYCMPLNPVWVVRDVGWFEVFQALQTSDHAQNPLKAWYPPESGLVPKMLEIHSAFQDGFYPDYSCPKPSGEGGLDRTLSQFGDLSIEERTDLAISMLEKQRKEDSRDAWARCRRKVRTLSAFLPSSRRTTLEGPPDTPPAGAVAT